MTMPAARLTDMHVCPMLTPGLPPIPHVGGPILGPCAPTVLIGNMPAARVSDMALCIASPPSVVAMGAFTVLTMSLPQAKIGSLTAHGGTVVTGFPTVLVGG